MKKINYLLSFILLFLCLHSSVYAEDFEINSKHAILYNLDDNSIIYEKKSEERTYVASLTKIMTAIVAVENIDNLNEELILTPDVFTGLKETNAAVAGFRIGNKVTYLDLLMGTMLPSGADAARGIAINITGNEKEYVKLMNNKAETLGLNDTHFVNITGLDIEGHYSTVKDIAILLQYALKNPTFRQIYTTREYTTTNGLKLYSTLRQHSSKINADTSHILGTKTGYTHAAGLCLSSIANYNGVNYLLVTTGANYKTNSPLQLIDALTIYNYYSSNYGYHNIIELEEKVLDIPIKYSDQKYYTVTVPKTISKYLPNTFNKEKVKYEYKGLTSLSYKNNYLDEIGKINIIYENELLDTIPIYLQEKITFSLLTFLIKTKLIYVIIMIVIIILATGYKFIKKKQKRKISH